MRTSVVTQVLSWKLMMPFSTGLGWSVLGSLSRTRTAAGLVCSALPCKTRKEKGSAGISPVAAPMPKSVPS